MQHSIRAGKAVMDVLRLVSRLGGALAVLSAAACEPRAEHAFDVRTVQSAIIDGGPDMDHSAVVSVSHRDGPRCSGTAIAPTLVVTARHCVVSQGSGGGSLSAEGFRIGFGLDQDHTIERYASGVDVLDVSDASATGDHTAMGEDVALLHLSEPMPSEVRPFPIRFDYIPRAGDTLLIVGYGVSSLQTGASGARLAASGPPSGYDEDAGVVEIRGPSSCFGDSGGPVLLEPDDELVGVVGQVGGSSDTSFCDVGLTYAATVANPRVREFLRRGCDEVGGCGPPETVADGGHEAAHPAMDAHIPDDPDARAQSTRDAVSHEGSPDAAARDASRTDTSVPQVVPSGGLQCSTNSTRGRTGGWSSVAGMVVLGLAVRLRRGRLTSRLHRGRVAGTSRAQ